MADKDWDFERDASGKFAGPDAGPTPTKKRSEKVEWVFRNKDSSVPLTVELTDWHEKDTGVDDSPFEEAPPYSVIVHPKKPARLKLTIQSSLRRRANKVTYKYTVRTTCKDGHLVIRWQLDPDLIIEG